jgi:L-lactate dehydrogenase complex protein LldG
MRREEFLKRVRIAARSGRAYRVHVHDDVPPHAGYVGGGTDLCRRLAEEVNAVGGFAQVVKTEAEANDALTTLLREYAAKRALCWQHPLLDRLGLVSLLASLGIEHVSHDELSGLPPAERQEKMLATDVGITSATYAIAETGSLAMASGQGTERSASLLPPVHVAIVERNQILPDLFDLFAKLDAAGAENIATNLTLITGPSKTGDIELQLTTGVHGPGKWHVIVGDW